MVRKIHLDAYCDAEPWPVVFVHNIYSPLACKIMNLLRHILSLYVSTWCFECMYLCYIGPLQWGYIGPYPRNGPICPKCVVGKLDQLTSVVQFTHHTYWAYWTTLKILVQYTFHMVQYKHLWHQTAATHCTLRWHIFTFDYHLLSKPSKYCIALNRLYWMFIISFTYLYNRLY